MVAAEAATVEVALNSLVVPTAPAPAATPPAILLSSDCEAAKRGLFVERGIGGGVRNDREETKIPDPSKRIDDNPHAATKNSKTSLDPNEDRLRRCDALVGPLVVLVLVVVLVVLGSIFSPLW